YQDFARFVDVDLAVAGDGETSLPLLAERVKEQLRSGRKPALAERGKKLKQLRTQATIGWDSSPITTARLAAEVHAQIKNDDWSLVGNALRMNWPLQLWNFDKPYQWTGTSGGAGIGYNAPASAGGALANKGKGRLSVAFQGDGDLMFVPSTLWTV